MRTRYSAWLISASVLCLAAVANAQNPPARKRVPLVELDEASMRKAATKRVLPEYPVEAVKLRKSGVSVSDVLVGKDGNVILVKVLEAPHPAIEKAVITAIQQWTFPPVTTGRGSEIQAVEAATKLTFYFTIDKAGKGIVSDPPAFTASPPARGAIEEAKAGDLEELRKTRNSAVLDIRTRQDFKARPSKAATNVPAQELVGRFGEMRKFDVVIIDCRDGDIALCRFAANILADNGTRRTVIVR